MHQSQGTREGSGKLSSGGVYVGTSTYSPHDRVITDSRFNIWDGTPAAKGPTCMVTYVLNTWG